MIFRQSMICLLLILFAVPAQALCGVPRGETRRDAVQKWIGWTMTKVEVRNMQRRLRQRKYYSVKIDGIIGWQTILAIENFRCKWRNY